MTLKEFLQHRPEKGGVREVMVIAFPMIISTACDGVMTFTDRMFLSRLSPDHMNAAMGGGVSLQVLLFLFIGLIGYTTALVAQYFGSGQKKFTSVALSQAVWVAFLAYPLILAVLPLLKYIFQHIPLPLHQVGYQIEYTRVLALGSVFTLLRTALGCYFSGLGKTAVVMRATLVAMLVNVGFDYLLIFGKLGFPALGIQGAALATNLGSISAVVILLFSYFKKSNREEFHVMESLRFDWAVMKKLLYFGYPAGLEMFLNFLAFSFILFLFQSKGNDVATAITIMFNWDLVSFIPLLGIEIAVTSLAGRYMGAGEPGTVHHTAISAIKIGLFYSLLILVLFVLIPGVLVDIFQPRENPEVFLQARPLAISMIRLAALYVTLEAMMVALIGVLRGAGDTHFTMLASVTAHWSFVPVLYLVMHVLKLSPLLGWFLMILLFMAFCAALFLRYKSGKWRKIQVIEKPT